MVQRQFTSQIEITGGLNRQFLQSLRSAPRSVAGLRREMSNLERTIRTNEQRQEELNETLRGLDEGSQEAMDLRREMRRLEEETEEANNRFNDLNRQSSNLENLTRRVRGIGVALTAVGAAITGSIIAGFREAIQLSNEISRVQVATGGLITRQQAQQVIRVSAIYDVDQSSLARGLNYLQRQLGLISSGFGDTISDRLTGLGIDVSRIVNLDDPIAQYREAALQLSQLEDQELRAAAAADLFGRTASTQVLTLSQNRETLNRFLADFATLPPISEENRIAIDNTKTALTELRFAGEDVRDAFLVGLAPSIISVSGGLREMANNTALWLQENERVGQVVGIFGLVATAAGGAVVGTAQLAETFLGTALFARQLGLVNFSTLIPSLRAATVSAFGLQIGLAPFLIIGVAVTAVVVGIGFAVTALADKVGGFGNLWELTWRAIKIGFLGTARAILTPMGLIITTINSIIDGIETLSAGAISLGNIPNPVEAIDSQLAQEVNAFRNDRNRFVSEAREEREESESQREAAVSAQAAPRVIASQSRESVRLERMVSQVQDRASQRQLDASIIMRDAVERFSQLPLNESQGLITNQTISPTVIIEGLQIGADGVEENISNIASQLGDELAQNIVGSART